MSAGALCALAATSGAMADTSTDSRIAELEAQVAELRGEGWLNEQRADEVRSIVQDVLADADTRASLMQNGMSGGYNGGFTLGSADGNWSLKLNGLSQVRFVWNNQDDSSGDTNRWGFENRRTRLKFSGHVVDPSWGYMIYGDFWSSGSFNLLDAWISKSFENGWSMRVGQFKEAYLREFLTSAAKGLTVERSLVNSEFSTGRVQGVSFDYSGDQFRGNLQWHNGMGRTNSTALTMDTEMAFAARGEFLAAGNWKQFGDMTSRRGSEYGALVGFAANYERGEFGTTSTGDQTETTGLTVDVAAESDGWNVFGALVYRMLDTNGGTDLDQYGMVVQGGYYFSDDLEGFARYEWGDLDTTADDLSVLTLGVNKYFSGHNMKWTTDLGYGINTVTSSWASSGAGYRADSGTDDGQFVLRSQLQVAF